MFSLCGASEVKNRREYKVHDDDHENGFDHRRSVGTPNLLGSQPRRKTFLAADGSDYEAEHGGFDQTGDDIAGLQSVEGGANVTAPGEARCRHTENATAKHTHEIGPSCETGNHQQHGKELGG